MKAWRPYLRLVHRAWKYRLRFDRPEITFLLHHLKRGDTAIDIGAHKGAYTYWLRQAVGSTGRVFSFEPQPALVAELQQIARRTPWSNVTIEHLGVSENPGELVLRVPLGGPSPGATFEPDAHARGADTLTIGVTSLDDYFTTRDDLPPVRFIKIDVEGHELLVFKGGCELLKRDRPALLFECEARHHRHDTIGRVFDFLNDLGYEGSFFLNGKRQPLDTFDVATHQRESVKPYCNNFLFLPSLPVSP